MIALKDGAALGDYVVLAPLPSGDETELWLAKAVQGPSADVPVVLRSVPARSAQQEALMLAAADEARVAVRIEHPHLARFVELLSDGGRWFTVSEFVSGRSLRQIMNRAGTVDRVPPVWFSVHVVAVIARALAHLHARCGELGTQLRTLRQIVSPDAIHVSFAGDPVLSAFGLAPVGAVPTVSVTSPIPSAYAYASPERLADAETAVADLARSDVYSLGVVLYELLTARRPFAGDSEENLLREVLDTRREPPPPSMVAPWVTRPLEDIVLAAIARDPRDRFQHAGDLADAMDQYNAWAGVSPSRKHVAQQVCGVVPHADSEPPPSARSSRSSQPPTRPVSTLRRIDAADGVSSPIPEPMPSGHVWDRVTAMARRHRDAEGEVGAGAAEPGAGTTEVQRHAWDRVLGAKGDGAPEESSTQQAVRHFEAGLDLARNHDFPAALARLEEAVRLDPENRVYGANLRRVRRALETG